MSAGLADERPEARREGGSRAGTRGAGHATHTRRLRALRLVVFAALLEVALILPFVDHLADSNPTIHFTQHGFIFLGGVLMGIALRDAYQISQS